MYVDQSDNQVRATGRIDMTLLVESSYGCNDAWNHVNGKQTITLLGEPRHRGYP